MTPRISTYVLIIQTTTVPATEAVLILSMQRPKVSTTILADAQNKHILRVDSRKDSTAVGKNSTSALAMLAAFCISVIIITLDCCYGPNQPKVDICSAICAALCTFHRKLYIDSFSHSKKRRFIFFICFKFM